MENRRLMWRIFVPAALGGIGVLVVFGIYALAMLKAAETGTKTHGSALAMVGLALGAAVLVGAFRLARHVAEPFEEAAEAAARQRAGEAWHRMPSGETAELATIAETINTLMRRHEEGAGALARRRTEQEAVLASMTEGVMAVDREGRVITLNPSAVQMFRMGGVSYEGRVLAEVVRNPDLLRFAREVGNGSAPAETEIGLLGPAGERRIRVGGTPLTGSDGTRIGTLLVLGDVTRLRRLESLRREFVANVSHELKTPITAIRGAVDTLADGALEDPDARERFFDMIQRQSERLANLVSDTLSLSRIEQAVDQGGVNLARGELLGVLKGAVGACEPQAQARTVDVEIACEPGLAARIDPPLLEQAVVNLIQNAVAHSPEGAMVRVSAEAAGDEVVIAVADDGPGISPEHLPRLFERFYRVDPSRSRELGGTGLGLAIVKHTALAHGGRVSVDSTPGQGSTFRIHLPRS